MRLPTATYRVQLRSGVGFSDIRKNLGYFQGLGISHLYLPPVFTANRGSTHGYDVTLPNEVDPSLGGLDGLRSLSRAARDHGLGIILDIVPNHTAFSVENPWFWDVLAQGRDSIYAGHFDIDWHAGAIVLPFLPDALEAMKQAGDLTPDWSAEQPVLHVGDLFTLPLAGPASDDLDAVLSRQHYQLMHWERERDSITHRRFFNVTGLIGMRVEDARVFSDMHRLVFELLAEGTIDGLRVDHIDGLADPERYLITLRDAVGPDTPIWVEKILTGDEVLPDWPVQGTTGYEYAADIATALTDGDGLALLDGMWRDATGKKGSFHDEVMRAKTEVLRNELAAELGTMTELAGKVLERDAEIEAGPESLREAVALLLEQMGVYRTYATDRNVREADYLHLAAVAERAASEVRSDVVIRRLTAGIVDAQTLAAREFRTRFQQVTGALIAKAHEDTAAFRWSSYLAACEVGSDPDARSMPFGTVPARLADLSAGQMILTSTHDTKRSEDARMRLVALSHLPEVWQALWREVLQTLPPVPEGAEPLDRNRLWYLTQTLLAAFHPTDPELSDRIENHMVKALREAKEISFPTHPNEAAEAPYCAAARHMVATWQANLPAPAATLIARGENLSLAMVALKFLSAGVPDLYQGCEIGCFRLTDPDNRPVIDYGGLVAFENDPGFNGRKMRLTKRMLDLRQRIPKLFMPGRKFTIAWAGSDLCVRTDPPSITVTIPPDADAKVEVAS